MSKLRAILIQEFDVLLRQRVGLILIFLLPVAILAIFGREATVQPVRLLVAGAPEAKSEQPGRERLLLILRETSALAVSTEPRTVVDPLLRLTQGKFDLLLNYEGVGRSELSMYSAETDPVRLERLERIGAGILRASAVIDSRLAAQKSWKPLFRRVWWSQPALYEDLFMLGTFPVNPLFEYFPQAADPRVNLLPRFLSVVLTVLPFLMKAVRAREPDPPAVIASWREAVTIAVGRSLVACAITLMSFLLLLIVAESLFGVLIKAGVFRMLALLLPALLASAFLGLGIPKLIRSPLSVVAISLTYLLLVFLLESQALPFADRPWPAQQVAGLLPSTFARPVLTDWIFGALRYDGATLGSLGWLGLQCIVYGALATFSLRRADVAAAATGHGAEEVVVGRSEVVVGS